MITAVPVKRAQYTDAFQGGQLILTDTIPHNASKPSLVVSDVELH